MTTRPLPPQRRRAVAALRVKMWLSDHGGGLLGLGVAVAAVSLVALGLVLLFHGSGPGEPIVGRIRSIWAPQAKGSPALEAIVDFPGGTTVVGLSSPTRCQVGGPIRLLKWKRPWVSVMAVFDPCPATPR